MDAIMMRRVFITKMVKRAFGQTSKLYIKLNIRQLVNQIIDIKN